MSQADIEYYRERATNERAAASLAANEHIAEIHEELARQYEALVEYAELRQPLRFAGASA